MSRLTEAKVPWLICVQAYISTNSLIILRGPNDLIQTISHGESDVLEAVAISEASGKLATCTKSRVFVYAPLGLDEGGLKVGQGA